MDYRVKVDTEAAMRAFDMLGTDGPRLVEQALRNIADRNAAASGAKAHGSLRGSIRVHDVGDTNTIALFYGPTDLSYGPYGVIRKGWWTNYGTGAQADGRSSKRPNRSWHGQRAQRWLKKVSKRKKQDAVASALLRAARRAGFDTNPGVG